MILSEFFYSIQGEGKYSGVPSIFLRTSDCNLRCNGKWKCDTWDLLSTGRVIYNDQIVNWMTKQGILDMVYSGLAHIVLTGGEPFFKVQGDAFFEFVTRLKRVGNCFVEVETNGTQMNEGLFNVVNHITCSPKLEGSGNKKDLRYKPDVLKKIMTHDSYCFKFVISSSEDFVEVRDIVQELNIPAGNIYLMPGAGSREELINNSEFVWKICEEWGYRFSSRLHLVTFDQKTGV